MRLDSFDGILAETFSVNSIEETVQILLNNKKLQIWSDLTIPLGKLEEGIYAFRH